MPRLYVHRFMHDDGRATFVVVLLRHDDVTVPAERRDAFIGMDAEHIAVGHRDMAAARDDRVHLSPDEQLP